MTGTSRIGFVGVGRMGKNMARRLNDRGYTISAIHDSNSKEANSLAQEISCEEAVSPARVAELSDIVLTVVTDDAAMSNIFAEDSPSSLLCHAKGRLFINFATISPEAHIRAETLVGQKGGTSLEALMASSITQAREGTLYLMCGGKKSSFEQARLILQELSSKLLYIGPAGEAAKVKALVNMVMNCNTAALAEDWVSEVRLGLTWKCFVRSLVKQVRRRAFLKLTAKIWKIVIMSAIFLPPMQLKILESPSIWQSQLN